ncbi:Glycosyl transferases group 1 [Salibacterium halotolerans]|uniref:Glycosyl transferases group 1 n=1 Tax=Salibacterium halotolerans TaxID=1884432 RepID=A0A1I5XI19_9BACI|nr:Glycosyl transferases group 1 [Salibacterium halotolerans]
MWIAYDTSRFVDDNFSLLEKELAAEHDLYIWRKPGHIHYILKQLPEPPDFILLLNDIGQRLYPRVKGLSTTNIPTGLFVNDVHRLSKIRDNYIRKNNIPYIFSAVRDTFRSVYPAHKHKLVWFPHFIDSDRFDDYQQEKNIELLMMGAVDDHYPLRQKIRATYNHDHRFVYHSHPGYHTLSTKEEKDYLIDRKYAMELNKAKLFFTCPSIYHYPVKKYFEALACRTLLLAPTFPELEDLGFIPGYHFVAVDETNFKEKADYYLREQSEREIISTQGYEFVHQFHSKHQRMKQLVTSMENIIQQHM